MNPLSWIDDELTALEHKKLRRRLLTRDGPQSVRLRIDGRELINFGSNDYLGLAADPRLAWAAAEAIQHEGFGSGASPLITGHGALHRRLEERLAEFEGTEAALVFSSGFAANAGSIAALVGPGDVVYCDRKNHASLFDGCRLSRADVRVYPHADCQRLASLLAESQSQRYRRRLIATDGLFSMDGDLAPLAELAELAARHDAMLLVDEAHATGIFGPKRTRRERTLGRGRRRSRADWHAEQGPGQRRRLRGRQPVAYRVAPEPCPAVRVLDCRSGRHGCRGTGGARHCARRARTAAAVVRPIARVAR